MSSAKPSSRLKRSGRNEPTSSQVVGGEQLADLAATAEVAGRAELAAGVAGVRDRLDERRTVRKARPADSDLEDAVGDRALLRRAGPRAPS